MAKYITRIELHKAENHTVTAQDYDTLHGEMKKKGFKRTIVSDDRRAFKLLDGEYRRTTTASNLDQVLLDAKAAAQAVVANSENVKDYSAFVSEYTFAQWYNLEQVI